MTAFNAGKSWAPDEVALLQRGVAEGDSPEAIAMRHGRTLNAVVSKAESMGMLVRIGNSYHRVEQDAWLVVSALISESRR